MDREKGTELNPIVNRVRFVCSNRALFQTPESLKSMMDGLHLTAGDFSVAYDMEWYVTNNWWDDTAFMRALREVGATDVSEKDVTLARLKRDGKLKYPRFL